MLLGLCRELQNGQTCCCLASIDHGVGFWRGFLGLAAGPPRASGRDQPLFSSRCSNAVLFAVASSCRGGGVCPQLRNRRPHRLQGGLSIVCACACMGMLNCYVLPIEDCHAVMRSCAHGQLCRTCSLKVVNSFLHEATRTPRIP